MAGMPWQDDDNAVIRRRSFSSAASTEWIAVAPRGTSPTALAWRCYRITTTKPYDGLEYERIMHCVDLKAPQVDGSGMTNLNYV